LIFRRWKPRAELRPRSRSAAGAALRVRWLGTAGHIVESATTTVLIDPFVTRPGFLRMLRPLTPDEDAIAARIPVRVDAVLCGHSHYDHLLDAPAIAKRTGAKLCGSATTAAFGRTSGVPQERLVVVPPEGATFSVGDLQIQYVPSLHGRIFLGRVPFPGEVTSPSLPARFWHYRMGGAFGIVVRAKGVTLYHNGSADLVDAQLDGIRADVLLVGLAGRKATPNYLQRLTDKLQPRLLVPTHHDSFFGRIDGPMRLLPGIDLDGFAAEAQAIARVITPDYDEVLAVPPDARDAALLEDGALRIAA
jgi:L-ascorbate metabolism protein UlaG (beta-lactamase superfamily)